MAVKITITQPGKPQLYQPTGLPRWEILGEVARGSDRGALVRNLQTGRYAMARAGEISNLDQRKIKAALNARDPGRPPEMSEGKRVNVYLDGPSLERAAELGEGNVSAGIRRALR